jgi:hypothetical protein
MFAKKVLPWWRAVTIINFLILVSEYLSAFLILVCIRRQHCLFSHREMNSLGIKINNLYTGTCCLYGAGRNDFEEGKSISRVIFWSLKWQREKRVAFESTATLYVIINRVKRGGHTPPPLPASANFSIKMECTPESGRCNSMSTVLCGYHKKIGQEFLQDAELVPAPSVRNCHLHCLRLPGSDTGAFHLTSKCRLSSRSLTPDIKM